MKKLLYTLCLAGIVTLNGTQKAAATGHSAKPDTVTVNELKKNFLEWKNGKAQCTDRPEWITTEFRQNGSRYFTSTPFPYCNNRICLYAKRESPTPGKTIVVKALQGSLSREQDKLYAYSSDDNELERSYGAQELYLLCHDLNKGMEQAGQTGYQERIEFSLLLYVTPSGTIQLHILEPAQPTADEKALIEQLQKSMNRQPKGIFGHFVTTDGRIFPARYLKATRGKNGRWSLFDYLSDDMNQIRP